MTRMRATEITPAMRARLNMPATATMPTTGVMANTAPTSATAVMVTMPATTPMRSGGSSGSSSR